MLIWNYKKKSFKQTFFALCISVPIIPDYLLALEEEQEARDLLGLFWNNTHVNVSHFSDLLFNLTFTDLNYTYSKGNLIELYDRQRLDIFWQSELLIC